MRYGKHFSTKKTPQSEPIPGREADQVKNNAGGYSFALGDWGNMDRFLILGTEGGTYYVGERKLTIAAAKATIDCLQSDPERAIGKIVEVSTSGRAPSNDPAIFALALACKYCPEDKRGAAHDAISKVCRTGTHLFQFCQAVKDLGGWSRGLRRGVSEFYRRPDADRQVVKYRQRDGWTHRDVLRLAHPKPSDDRMMSVLAYAAGKGDGSASDVIAAYEKAKSCTDRSSVKGLVKLITDHNLTWEMVPTEALAWKETWEALLDRMPMTAMIRNLGRMSSIGVLGTGLSEVSKKIVSKITDEESLSRSKIHPFQILLAMKTYSSGSGFRGGKSWNVNQRVVDALDQAFYMSFGNVRPTGKNIMLALDVSGSMSYSKIRNSNISASEASAAMALITAKVEQNYEIMAFSTEFMEVKISPRMRLDDAVRAISGLPFSGTDCAVPMLHAKKNNLDVDAFVTYTDSETWFGGVHPSQALTDYRAKSGIDSKMVVVGLTSTNFTIADPKDHGSMDVVGFDASAPSIIGDFIGQEAEA